MDAAETILEDRYVVERELDRTALVVRERGAEEAPPRVLRLVEALPDDPDGAVLEAELRRSLGWAAHPHLAAVHEVGRDAEGRLCFVQDLVDGESFFSWAVGRDPEALVRSFGQLLRALAAYHDRGVVIGGRRPLRIVVEERAGGPHVRVTDPGGFVEEGTRVDRAGPVAGSLAPERRVGARVDRRANLYELGAVLYELLAGSSHQGFPIRRSPAAGALAPLSEVAPTLPIQLTSFVMLLLRPLPEDRPASAAAALSGLAGAAGIDLGPPLEPPAGLAPASLLGREDEVLNLLAWARPLVRAAGGQAPEPPARRDPSLVVLRGEAGAGKRRLLDALALRLEVDGVRVVRGTCAERGQGPFGPFSAILGRLLGPDPSRRLGEASNTARWVLGELLPHAMKGLAPGARPAPDEDPDEARGRLLDGLVDPILAAAQEQPTLLVLGDLERARAPTLDLLERLARRAWVARHHDCGEAGRAPDGAREPLLLVVAGAGPAPRRDGRLPVGPPRLGAPAPERFEELLTLPFVRPLPLAPLAERDLLRLGAEALGVEDPPDGLSAALEAAALGVPGRALRIAADVAARRAPTLDAAAALADDVLARVEDPSDRALLDVLAVLERPAGAGLLAAAAGLDPSDAAARLRALAAAGALEPRSLDRWALASPTLAAARLRDLSPGAEVEVAGRLVALLVDREGRGAGLTRRPEDVLEVVELATRTAPDAEGLAGPEALTEHGPSAGAHLEALGAFAAAADLYRHLAEHDGGWQWRRHEADARERSGDPATAARAYHAILAGSQEHPPLMRAGFLRRLARCLAAEGLEAEARERLRQARAALGEAPEGKAALLAARLEALAADLLLAAGEREEAQAACERGQDVLRSVGSAGAGEAMVVRAALLEALGRAAHAGDDLDEAEQLLRAALALEERQHLSREAARALQRLGNVAMARGDYSRAESHWRASLERWEALDDRRGEAHVRSSLGLAAARRGSLHEAREELGRALRLREDAGDDQGTAATLHNLGYVYTSAGALPEAAAAYRRCLALRLDLGDRWYAASASNNLGQVLLELGQAEPAREHLVDALEARQQLGDRRGEAATLSALAELELRAGAFGQAIACAAEARAIRAEVGGAEDDVDSFLRDARIELGLGDYAAAQTSVEHAISLGHDQDLRLVEAPTRLLLGEILARRGVPARARQELERSRRAAERVGDRLTSRAAAIELAALQLATGKPDHARALLDSRPVPRPGRLRPLEGRLPPDRHGLLRVRERLLRARIELARDGGSLATAARCAEEAIEEARRAELRDLEWRALQALAAACELRGRHERALELTVAAQELVEELHDGVPLDRAEAYLAADPAREAALKGDSPLVALAARPGGVTDSDLKALRDRPAPTIEPAPAEAARAAGRVTSRRLRRPRIEKPAAPVVTGVARDDFGALVRLNRTIVDEPDVRRAFEAIVAAACGLCRGERGFLGVFGDGPDEVSVLATCGLDDVARPRQRFLRAQAFKAAESGRLVLSADVLVDDATKKRAQLLGLGLRSVIAASVSTPDGRRSALYLDAPYGRGQRLGAREVELLEVLADQCAMAMGRASLEEALGRRQGVAPGVPLRQFLQDKAAREKPHRLRTLVRFGDAAWGLAGRSRAVAEAVSALEKFAASDAALLIEGPAGVGKGVVARAAHDQSGRTGALVTVDLRELADGAIEAELFGHEAGAFPGAGEARPGLIRRADGGTLLLERLDEAAPAVQAKLVQVLEDRTLRPLGADGPLPFDARIVATAADADAAAREGELRPDLLALVGQVRIALPPLDERPEDKGPLIDVLLEAWEGDAPAIPGPVRALLEARRYPGNARELHAVLRAAAVRARGRPLRPDDLPAERPAEQPTLAEATAAFERRYVTRALRAHDDDLTAAAKALGLTRRALQKKLADLGIEPGRA